MAPRHRAQQPEMGVRLLLPRLLRHTMPVYQRQVNLGKWQSLFLRRRHHLSCRRSTGLVRTNKEVDRRPTSHRSAFPHWVAARTTQQVATQPSRQTDPILNKGSGYASVTLGEEVAWERGVNSVYLTEQADRAGR